MSIRHINNEIKKIAGLEFDCGRLSKNGIFCPKLTEENIKRVHDYVINESSYSDNSGDGFVRKYFEEHTGDVSMSSIIIKIILINTVDSTNLKLHLGKDYYKLMAKRIIDNKLEDIIKTGGKFGDCFRNAAAFPPKKTSQKEDTNLFVFLSKYITRVNQYCYKRNDYSILDKVIKENLKHYNGCAGITVPNIEKLRLEYKYDEYCDIYKPILEKIPNVNREMIDHFVWFTFKKEAVGDIDNI